MHQQKYLIVIGGATATGKTSCSIRLAQHFKTSIISADSRQFYREMSIGTAKPTLAELKQAPHHFVDSLSIHDHYSVGDFEKDTIKLLEDLYKKNDIVVLSGGSGLFIKAVCEGLNEFPEVSEMLKNKLNKEFEVNGIEYLQEKLKAVDPDYYEKVDQQNPRRMMRAIGVYEVSGIPFSEFQNKPKPKRIFQPIYLYLKKDREKLYEDINQRVDEMMDLGLENEVTLLKSQLHLNALQTIGYQEFAPYFENNVTLDQVVDKIKQHTRNYAKRQMTWLRKNEEWKAFEANALEEIIEYLEKEMIE